MKKLHTFQNDALGFHDATTLSQMLQEKEVSPKELAQAAISRLQSVEPQLGAIAVDCFETALKRSEQPFYGPFGGIPTFVKDNEEVIGLPRQMGTLAFKARASKKNSPFVDQFISTGLNVLGKTTLPEFGLICSTENPKWYVTRNPWDTDFTPGGSSSGSAALVAAGVVPIAMANDGAGSTRIPASCCGLVGLKPSRNRLVNIEGSKMLPLNIVYEGVLTRSVRDTILFFQSAEKYFHYNKLERISNEVLPVQKRLKIVFFENIPKGKIGHQDEATLRTIEETARLLESLGHHVEKHPFPIDIDTLSDHYLTYYGFLAFFLQDLGRFLLNAKVNKSELENFTTGLVKHFKKNAFSLPGTLRLLKKVGADVENRFADYDIILTPVVSHSVPKIGHFNPELPYEEISKRAVQFASYPGMQNITGSPAISLPMGISNEGLPLGVQLVAAYGKDQLLLELALELESAKPFRKIYE